MTDAQLFYSLPQRLTGRLGVSLIMNDDGTPLDDAVVAQGWILARFWPKEPGDSRPRDTDIDLEWHPTIRVQCRKR